MLRSLKQIYGSKLGASDGEIGQVQDFYFDDKHWVVRYVVADSSAWISKHKVLLSPHAFGSLFSGGKILPVNLTRKQIENSPPIESHKPVSREYEEEYCQYYGWPCYWHGDALWGMSGFPILSRKSKPFAGEPVNRNAPNHKRAEVHLQSVQTVIGYQIQTGDQTVGHVVDFMIDEKSWEICRLVVNTGHRFSGRTMFLSPREIDRISWEESKLFTSVVEEVILQRAGCNSSTDVSPNEIR